MHIFGLLRDTLWKLGRIINDFDGFSLYICTTWQCRGVGVLQKNRQDSNYTSMQYSVFVNAKNQLNSYFSVFFKWSKHYILLFFLWLNSKTRCHATREMYDTHGNKSMFKRFEITKGFLSKYNVQYECWNYNFTEDHEIKHLHDLKEGSLIL